MAMAIVMAKNKPLTRVQTSGVADIGGAFKLTDHLGRPVTDKSLLGKFSLVFFGFTQQ